MAGGLWGQRAWGEMLHVHSWPGGTASGLAERGGGGGGRLVAPGDAVGYSCAGHGKERRARVGCHPVSLRGASPGLS